MSGELNGKSLTATPWPNGIDARKCHGACERTHGGHDGPIHRVHVWGSDVDWGEFFYCDNAVAEDRENRGMKVEILETFHE